MPSFHSLSSSIPLDQLIPSHKAHLESPSVSMKATQTSFLPFSIGCSLLRPSSPHLTLPLINISLSFAIWEAALQSFPHSTRTSSASPKLGICPMNKWYDTECKSLHQELRHAFRHSLPTYPTIRLVYRHLLRRKKRQFISQRRRELSALLAHSPKQFWGTILPRRSPPPTDLDTISMFSHTSNLSIRHSRLVLDSAYFPSLFLPPLLQQGH